MDRTHLSSSDSGSKDGSGAADNDQPYQFGRRPRSVAPWPFTERQYALLLVMRGRIADAPNPNDEPQPSATLDGAARQDETSRPAGPTPPAAQDLRNRPRRRAA